MHPRRRPPHPRQSRPRIEVLVEHAALILPEGGHRDVWIVLEGDHHTESVDVHIAGYNSEVSGADMVTLTSQTITDQRLVQPRDEAGIPIGAPVVVTDTRQTQPSAALTIRSELPGQLRVPGVPVAQLDFTADGYQGAHLDIWVVPEQGQWRVLDREDDAGNPIDTLDIVAIHAALLKNGTVLFFGPVLPVPPAPADVDNLDATFLQSWDPEVGHRQTWHPATGSEDAIAMHPVHNLFCSGHAFLPDGALLVAGGHAFSAMHYGGAEAGAIVVGILGFLVNPIAGLAGGAWVSEAGRGSDHNVYRFNPDAPDGNKWQRFEDMDGARWYPTCTTLPNGDVLIVAGSATGAWTDTIFDYRVTPNEDFDLFHFRPDGGSLAHFSQRRFLEHIAMYPFVKVLPGGQLFVHSFVYSFLIQLDLSHDPPGRTVHGPFFSSAHTGTRNYPAYGSCVLLPLDPASPEQVRLLVVGGSLFAIPDHMAPATASAEIFDYNYLSQIGAWRSIMNLQHARILCDATLLANGMVLVSGGASQGNTNTNVGAVHAAELFDPRTEQFRPAGIAQVERRYHATALLLPDGRVLTAGSTGGIFPPTNDIGVDKYNPQFRLEVYEPPYLFAGLRPQIEQAPDHIVYNTPFEITLHGSDWPAAAALIRNSSVTHGNNMDQRYVGLQILGRTTDMAGRAILRIQAPLDGTIAPPGFYMLVVQRRSSLATVGLVPSEAWMLSIGTP